MNPDDLPKLSYEEFKEINDDLIVPLDIKIDLDQFRKEIESYRSYFKQWGKKRTQYPRYGLSLVNLDGRIDQDVDPACYPLDQWWQEHPNEFLWDHDFNTPTEVLSLPCFDVLNPIKEYMVRSNLLLWNSTGHFVPHIDMKKEYITHFRLWGISTDETGYSLKYGDNFIHGWEPGRLYLIDTIEEHSAYALDDDVFTFFLAVDIRGKDVLKASKEAASRTH